MKIQTWNKRLEKLLSEMPDGYWLYVASGELWVMNLDKNKKQKMNKFGGFDQAEKVCAIKKNVLIEGGDW